MAIKQVCPDPDDDFDCHDHGACVDEELIVKAHQSETMTWDEKLSIIMLHYRSIRYWTHQLGTSLLFTPTGEKLESLGEQANETLTWILELKKRGKLSKVYADEMMDSKDWNK